jgi:hypothetical protein
MNNMSRAGTVPTAEWSGLLGELDRWGEAGRVATFWWRDDDAESVTPQLGRLLALAGAAPVALAVVPAAASRELPGALAPYSTVAVVQHGWRHANHAAAGKKSEFPAERPPGEAARDIAAGRERLARMFGERALPVFVPPWNRIAPQVIPLLAEAGIRGLSVMAPRPEILAQSALAAIDAHVDLVDWHGGRRFIGTAAALGGLVAALRTRHGAPAASGGATGILTHHLVMDDATAAFLGRLQDAVASHAAARWADIRESLP